MLYNPFMEIDLSPLKPFFWDVDFRTLRWQTHRDFIIQRVLTHGDLDALRWLRARVGDGELKKWVTARQGRGLSPRQIRYFALIFEIDSALADGWVAEARDSIWEKRR